MICKNAIRWWFLLITKDLTNTWRGCWTLRRTWVSIISSKLLYAAKALRLDVKFVVLRLQIKAQYWILGSRKGVLSYLRGTAKVLSNALKGASWMLSDASQRPFSKLNRALLRDKFPSAQSLPIVWAKISCVKKSREFSEVLGRFKASEVWTDLENLEGLGSFRESSEVWTDLKNPRKAWRKVKKPQETPRIWKGWCWLTFLHDTLSSWQVFFQKRMTRPRTSSTLLPQPSSGHPSAKQFRDRFRMQNANYSRKCWRVMVRGHTGATKYEIYENEEIALSNFE